MKPKKKKSLCIALKIKVPKGGYLCAVMEELFLVPQRTFQKGAFKRTIFFSSWYKTLLKITKFFHFGELGEPFLSVKDILII